MFVRRFAWVLLVCSVTAHDALADDTYDSVSGKLTIPQVAVGSRVYTNVVVTVDRILAVAGGTALTDYDSYDGATNKLSIPTVRVGDAVYTNVSITVGKILSYGDSQDFAVATLNAFPTDIDKVIYPDSYLAPAAAGTLPLSDPCQLDIPQMVVPRKWLGSYPLPAVKGAPFAANVSLALSVKDIMLTDNPTFNPGCKGSLKAEFDRTIAHARKLNAEVVYVPQWHWLGENADGSWYVMRAENSIGPVSDSDLSYFVNAAHKAGLQVMMRNQIQGLLKSASNAVVPEDSPANYARWFAALTDFTRERGAYFQTLGIDYWELGCSEACIYRGSGTGSAQDKTYFGDEYLKLATVMKTVYTGKVYMSSLPWIWDRADVMAKVDLLRVSLWDNGYVPSDGSPYTVANYKQVLQKESLGENTISLYQNTGKTMLFDLSMQSRANYYTMPGYLEETGCVSSFGDLNVSADRCLERETVPDFSMQAIYWETVFETIAAVNWKNKVIVQVNELWATDSMVSSSVFPNLGSTIRNKPAEGIVKLWFARP